jgi:hypothetical protein
MTAREYERLVGARFSASDKELIDKVCLARGETVSSFIRRIVRRELASLSYYSADEKKALGVSPSSSSSQSDREEEGGK